MNAMATKIVQLIEDDIDGTGDAQTITFALEGTAYEIDLNEQHAAELRQALDPWVTNARRASTPRGRRPSTAPTNVRPASPLKGRTTLLAEKGLTATEVRTWAQENGVQVNDRGRIPDALIEQYEAAQADTSVSPEAPEPMPEPKAAVKRATARKRAPRKRAPAKKAAVKV